LIGIDSLQDGIEEVATSVDVAYGVDARAFRHTGAGGTTATESLLDLLTHRDPSFPKLVHKRESKSLLLL
jgi:hypothetical protein